MTTPAVAVLATQRKIKEIEVRHTVMIKVDAKLRSYLRTCRSVHDLALIKLHESEQAHSRRREPSRVLVGNGASRIYLPLVAQDWANSRLPCLLCVHTC